MLKLIDLIKLAGVKLDHSKIHLANPSDYSEKPLDAFFAGTFRKWQEMQNRRNFQCKQILSLIHLERDRWLFAGVYLVDDVKRGNWRAGICYQYSTHEVSGLEDLVGMAIIQFERRHLRQSYLWLAKYKNRLLIAELRSQRMTIGDFPGYKSVLLSYRMLQTVVRESNTSWSTALSNVAGVYLITDTSDGKLYVGSAYGGEGIWKRWTDYAQNGHGGNKEIAKLLNEKGSTHAEHFQFSLLEVCDLDSDKDRVIERETHWKNVLKTREFGLNKN